MKVLQAGVSGILITAMSVVVMLAGTITLFRARRLYSYLGWQPTDDVREAPWPPHPLEVRYTRLLVQSER